MKCETGLCGFVFRLTRRVAVGLNGTRQTAFHLSVDEALYTFSHLPRSFSFFLQHRSKTIQVLTPNMHHCTTHDQPPTSPPSHLST
jgi:hypothetical protein